MNLTTPRRGPQPLLSLAALLALSATLGCHRSGAFAAKVDHAFMRECGVDNVTAKRTLGQRYHTSGCGAEITYHCPIRRGFVDCRALDLEKQTCEATRLAAISKVLEPNTRTAVTALCTNTFCDTTSGKKCSWVISLLDHTLDRGKRDDSTPDTRWLLEVASTIAMIWREGAAAGVSWAESVGLSLAILQLELHPTDDSSSDERTGALETLVQSSQFSGDYYDLITLLSKASAHGIDSNDIVADNVPGPPEAVRASIGAALRIDGLDLEHLSIGSPRSDFPNGLEEREHQVWVGTFFHFYFCQIKPVFKDDVLASLTFHCRGKGENPRAFLEGMESFERSLEQHLGEMDNSEEAFMQRSLGAIKLEKGMDLDDTFYHYKYMPGVVYSCCFEVKGDTFVAKIKLMDPLRIKPSSTFCEE